MIILIIIPSPSGISFRVGTWGNVFGLLQLNMFAKEEDLGNTFQKSSVLHCHQNTEKFNMAKNKVLRQLILFYVL